MFPEDPTLAPEEQAALLEARRLFEAGLYFECHDVLEEAWAGHRGPARETLQGLIQSAVAFYHLGNGNRSGARSLLARALARLAPYPAHTLGLDIEDLRGQLKAWDARLQDATEITAEEWAAARPTWRTAS
ncbi:MAG: DUF309 domain-containing protein [Vicinamibacteria bacterium]|nr:DUF309 domain-containing protein [Vicinamibacteria bacterium]